MKNAVVDLRNHTLTVNGETCTLVEAGLHTNADGNDGYQYDKAEIVDAIFERYDDVENVQFVGGEFQNFSAFAEIADLEREGWDFDIDHDDETTREQWYIRIEVSGDGRTTWSMHQHRKYGNNTVDGGWTGDDAATIECLRKMRDAGLLWSIDENYNM